MKDPKAQAGKKATKTYSWPACSANWQAALDGETIRETIEFPIHSDAWITGEITNELGPYKFLNTISLKGEHETHLYPSVVLRVDWHVPEGQLAGDLARTNAKSYHGGRIEDELAALLGLCLGIRAKAGGITRRFDPVGDPKGHPWGGTFKAVPPLLLPRQSACMLPLCRGTHCLDSALFLGFRQFYELPFRAAAAVVKAARLHQEAL